jgi:hypothetical protein
MNKALARSSYPDELQELIARGPEAATPMMMRAEARS